MAYRAEQKFTDPNNAIEVLSKLPENGLYKVNGSMYPRKPSVIFSEHDLEEAIEETYVWLLT